jgi:hypothetical protein
MQIDSLPQFIASLSKYYRVEDHYSLIALIVHDIPESDLRSQVDHDLYATAKARYLTVINGIVLRDKLVDLVHNENGFTERVKMVMYFLFMFRDPRYRQFICEELGKEGGKWDTSIFRNTNEYFKNAGGRKAFTNLRQFLFQTQILDEHSLVVNMPPLSTWFPDAVQIAAEAIKHLAARKSFLASPHGFLIRHKLNALLNASPGELAALEFGGTYEEADDLLPQIELPEGKLEPAMENFKRWDRRPPSLHRPPKTVIETDPAALERANGQHFMLEKKIVELCKEEGLIPKTNKHVDLMADLEHISLVFEMKSCSIAAVRGQLRRAISQLLEYRYIYRRMLKKDVRMCIVLERKPRGGVSWLLGYVESLGIGLMWKNDANDRFNCTPSTKKMFGDLLHQVLKTDF